MGLYLKKFTRTHTKLSEEQQLFFLKRLSRLIDHGYSFLEALDVIKWDISLEETAEIIADTLKRGNHIDKAFEKAGFHATIIAYLYFVRFNGDIQVSIQKCIIMFTHRMTQIKRFKQVIRYPIVLSAIFFILLFFLKTSVLPSFADIFNASNESSKTILISIAVIDILISIFIVTIITGVLIPLFWSFYKKNFPIEKQLSIYEKIPIYRHILKIQTSYYVATHISMFLKTGMSMKEIIIQMKEQKKLPILSYYAELMYSELQQGHYITQLLLQLPFMEEQLALLFDKNNNALQLEQDLDIFAQFLTEELEIKIMKFITLIQPIVFTFLAFMIIFMYITLMWPMFQLIKTI